MKIAEVDRIINTRESGVAAETSASSSAALLIPL